MLWGKVAWWAVSFAAVPVAQYVWKRVMELPDYLDEVAANNRRKERKNQILFRKFSEVSR